MKINAKHIHFIYIIKLKILAQQNLIKLAQQNLIKYNIETVK